MCKVVLLNTWLMSVSWMTRQLGDTVPKWDFSGDHVLVKKYEIKSVFTIPIRLVAELVAITVNMLLYVCVICA